MRITVSGLESGYTDQGTGRVIVLLHGWGTSKENFSELSERLASRYRVIAVDFPGFGESAMPPFDWQVQNYVEFVAEFLKVLNIDDVYSFIVHSFGGRVAIKGLSTGILHAEKLVLIDAAGISHSNSMRNMAFAVLAKLGKFVMRLPVLRSKYEVARQKLHEQAGSTDYAASGVLRQIFLNVIHEDLRSEVGNLTLQTLIIWGSNDTETPLADARFFQANIKGSTLKILQGAGHFVHTEQPEKVAQFIEEFLA